MDMPEVAHLDPRTNSVSLIDVGSGALETWITYPGIAVGDAVFINWRGRGVNGEVSDVFGQRDVGALDGTGRWRFPIPNAILAPLSGGVVFYSFQRLDAGGDPIGDESLRRFFFIDRPPLPMWVPEVAHLYGAHDLVIDIETLDPSGVLVVTPAYTAMDIGQTVTLVWQPWYDATLPGFEVELRHTVSADDVGRPISWRLDYSDVFQYFDGFAHLFYRIEYPGGSPTRSAYQRFDIVWGVPPTAPLLAAPVVPGLVGNILDPDDPAYVDGVWLVAENYPELTLGDSLVLYVEGPELGLRTFRADVTSIDSGRLAFFLERDWLQNEINRGQQVTLSYQFARPGTQRLSQPLALTLQRPLFLPLPIIRDAIAEGGDQPHQRTIYPSHLQNGAQVTVPAEAITDGGDLRVHWEGHGSTGNLVIDTPDTGFPRRFSVPKAAMAANLGHRLWVYYSVTKPGQAPQASSKLDLKVKDYETGAYPVVQLEGVQNQRLSLAQVPANGCRCTLGYWPFMSVGQRLGMSASGVPLSGKPGEWVIRARNESVTDDEYYDGEIVEFLPRAFLQGLQLNKTFRVSVEASFDDGATWRNFRSVDITLIN